MVIRFSTILEHSRAVEPLSPRFVTAGCRVPGFSRNVEVLGAPRKADVRHRCALRSRARHPCVRSSGKDRRRNEGMRSCQSQEGLCRILWQRHRLCYQYSLPKKNIKEIDLYMRTINVQLHWRDKVYRHRFMRDPPFWSGGWTKGIRNAGLFSNAGFYFECFTS